MLFPNRHDADLLRRKPEGETSLEVLDDNADKTLQGAIDGTVQYHRHLLLSLRILEGTAEVMRKLEIQLYRSALPLSSEGILNLEVNLRAVKSTVSLIDFETAFSIRLGKNLL